MRTLLMILAAAAACGMSGLLYQKAGKAKTGMAQRYIEGFFVLFCLGGVLAMPLIKLRMAFSVYRTALLLAAGGILLAGGVFAVFEWRKHTVKEDVTRRPTLPILLAGLVFAGLAVSFFLYEPSVGTDLTAESIDVTVRTNTMFEYNPVTGRKLETGIYPQSKLMILPLIYSVMYQAGGAGIPFFLYQLLPVLVLFLNFLVFWQWSILLFPGQTQENREHRGMFLLFYGLLLWFGDYLYATFSYRLLHEAWKGESIFAVVLIPWLAWLCMKAFRDGLRLHGVCSLMLCMAAGIFLVPWKTAVISEGLTAAFFVSMWLIRRGRQWLMQRHS